MPALPGKGRIGGMQPAAVGAAGPVPSLQARTVPWRRCWLLAARDEEGSGIDDRQVRDEVLPLFLAGHETTANALAWTWNLLARHPQAEAGFHSEIEAVLGDRLPAHDIVEPTRVSPSARGPGCGSACSGVIDQLFKIDRRSITH